MTIERSQSDIAEVRDQLCLDTADQKYLNVVSANLGLERPPFGFSDDLWRAVVKAIALQYKDIRTKFEEVLTLILGPKVTQCGALSVDASMGDTSIFVVNSAQFPQLGTIVIDEGLPTEETVQYGYIDRYANRIDLNSVLLFNHTAVNAEWETGIISPVAPGSSNINVFDASGFPDPSSVSYTVNVGRGTIYETAGEITSLNELARYISTFPILEGITGLDMREGRVALLTALQSQENAYYLNLADLDFLKPESGWLQTSLDATYTTVGGTSSFVTISGGLTPDLYGGYWVLFEGNITAALANKIGYVLGNNSTTFFFDNVLPTFPSAGDNFTLLSNFQYIRAIKDDSAVLMKKEFPDLNTLAPSTEFSIAKPTATVAIAQVQVKGTGWDVIQSDPRHVEILLPSNFLENDLRSASYIRETGLSGSATADATRAFGDTDLSVASTSTMPLIGTLEHDSSTKRYAYYIPHTWLAADAAAGDTNITVVDTSLFPVSGSLTINGNTVLYSVTSTTTLTVGALPAAVRIGDLVKEENIIRLAKGLLVAVAISDTFSFYSNYDSGDIWNVDDVWPGPYVWNSFAETHKKQTVPNNTLTSFISGPALLSIDKEINSSVLEINDAATFPIAVPYSITLGENGGNIEVLSVQEISFRSRTYSTTTATINPGDLSVEMTALTGPTSPNHSFPDAGPYRVVVDPLTASQEVLEVSETATGPNRLVLTTPAVGTHFSGASVVLLADLLRVSPSTGDDHLGLASSTEKFKLYAAETQNQVADLVRPLYASLTLAGAGTDFPTTEGKAVINFGSRLSTINTSLVSIVTTSITCADTSAFPTTGYPYTIYLDVGAGPLLEEVLHVTNNNTGTGVLTVSHPPVFSHVAGRRIEFRPGPTENISYNSRTGSTLSFDTNLQIEHTHHKAEYIAPTVGTGFPRNTGFDFALRIPVTIEDRIRFIVDLIRAAGVEVTFVNHR